MVFVLIIFAMKYASWKTDLLLVTRTRSDRLTGETDVIITNVLTMTTKKETYKRGRDCGL